MSHASLYVRSTVLARAGRVVVVAIMPLALAACGIGSVPQGGESATTATAIALEIGTLPVENAKMGYCFAYPRGYGLVGGDETPEVVGPPSDTNPHPGLLWITMVDAGGKTAEAIAEEEVEAVAGLEPPRYTVVLGGEEALVLDGMPGQDPIRKVYLVRDGMLYTLSFSPYRSGNAEADAQMETLYAVVTSSWQWLSSEVECTGTD